MVFNHLVLFSWMVVLVTSMPPVDISITPPTTVTLEESDPHNTENVVFLGSLESIHSEKYGVYGNVSAVNCTTLIVENFSYSDNGIRVHWIAGVAYEISKHHSSNIIIPDETGNTERIQRTYSNETFYLHLPDDKTLLDVNWIALLCTSFNLNLGSVHLPSNFTCEHGTDILDTDILDTDILDADSNILDTESCADGNIRITNDSIELGELLGEFIPTFYSFDYKVNGTFYTVKNESQKIYINDFNYSGDAPLVYFYVGLTMNAGINNFYVPRDYHNYDPCNITEGFIIGELTKDGQRGTISKYEEQSILLTLPSNYTIYNIRWLMVWCHVYALDMGHVWNDHYEEEYPRNKREISSPYEMDMIPLGDLVSIAFDVSGSVYAINATTLFISGFSYNGEAPDAYFYAGSTEKIGAKGFKIPDEMGSEEVLRPYENENVTLALPYGKTIKDIAWLSIFCDSYLEDFGHIRIDSELRGTFDLNASSVHLDEESASDDQIKTSVQNKTSDQSKPSKNSENMVESKMPQKDDPDLETEMEPHPHPEPEPGHTNYGMPHADESTDTKGKGSLTTTSYPLISIGLYFLFK